MLLDHVMYKKKDQGFEWIKQKAANREDLASMGRRTCLAAQYLKKKELQWEAP